MGTRLMFIGEGPGEQEDLQGRPFVGRSGDILREAYHRIDIPRSTLFITNVVKCRPPGNRNPALLEMEVCSHFLYEEIKLVNPRVIVALGKVASEYLLERPVKITKENGHLHFLDHSLCENDPPIMTVFHPAYVLRNRKPEIQEAFFQAIKDAKEVAYGTLRTTDGGLST
jgi:DNA polymerase